MRDHLSPIFYSGTGVILRWPQTELNASASWHPSLSLPSAPPRPPTDLVSYQDRRSRENFANGARFSLRPTWVSSLAVPRNSLCPASLYLRYSYDVPRLTRARGQMDLSSKSFPLFRGGNVYLLLHLQTRDPGGYQFLDCSAFLFRASKVTARWGSEINAINKLAWIRERNRAERTREWKLFTPPLEIKQFLSRRDKKRPCFYPKSINNDSAGGAGKWTLLLFICRGGRWIWEFLVDTFQISTL